MRAGDVISWQMGAPRPDPPHIEDVLVDPIRDRPRRLRHLTATQRAEFCADHLDRAAADVLSQETRSLCLLRPDSARATWALDQHSCLFALRARCALCGKIYEV